MKLLFGEAYAFQLVWLCTLLCVQVTPVNPGDYESIQILAFQCEFDNYSFWNPSTKGKLHTKKFHWIPEIPEILVGITGIRPE